MSDDAIEVDASDLDLRAIKRLDATRIAIREARIISAHVSWVTNEGRMDSYIAVEKNADGLEIVIRNARDRSDP